MVQDWKGLLLKAIRVQGLVSVQREAKAHTKNTKIKLNKDKEFVDDFKNLILIKVLHIHNFKS